MIKRNKKVILTFILLSLFFLIFSSFDILFSSFMFRFKDIFSIFSFPEFIKIFVLATTAVLLAILLVRIFMRFYLKRQSQLLFKALFLFITLVLGPGLIVNVVFKENWGRARPVQITDFGGDRQFTPPFVMTNKRGSSFVSGDASVGFWLIAFAYITKRRKLWLAVGIIAGSLIGLGRIVEARHFLSDVIFSGFFVYFCIEIVWYIFRKFNFIKGLSPSCSQP